MAYRPDNNQPRGLDDFREFQSSEALGFREDPFQAAGEAADARTKFLELAQKELQVDW